MFERWKGDGEYVLPAATVEPYRLWFEFLKLAASDPEVTIDETVYADWGDYRSPTFSRWWSGHWRSLFAVRSKVERLDAGAVVGSEPDSITLTIPLSGHSDEVLAQVAAYLDREGVNLKRQGRFALSLGYEHGFLKQLDKARRYHRLYSYWLRHADADPRKRIERAARDYVRWYEGWEAKIKAGSRRRVTPIPYFYKVFVGYLDAGGRKSGTSQVLSDMGNAENARRQIVRDIRIARKLAANVAMGVFPGTY
ncbi:hypothetical protein [Novosphingobium sp. PASSN1]|uniref:hypothetical protein n=1 Tax=Novosphingobium sp. PASSN1 TaxID=2015561 RepID=UPI000BDCD842|nr:hypothetical protein [Novosphingobium sp. PASSN1]OYU36366.1 MAG: hypothetical protein CFE35_03410 [Novosphingobium sp. PASSN1]